MVTETVDGVIPGQQYRYQTITLSDQNPPVQNDWYTVGAWTDTMLTYLMVSQDHGDGAVSKNIQVEVTLDGAVIDTTLALANAGAGSWLSLDEQTDEWIASAVSLGVRWMSGYQVPLYAGSMLIRFRITSVIGTAQRIRCWVRKYVL